MPNTVFRTYIEAQLLKEANEVLALDGITVNDAFLRLVKYIVAEGQMPYLDYLDPNATTLAAMAEAAQGELVTAETVAELMAELNEDD